MPSTSTVSAQAASYMMGYSQQESQRLDAQHKFFRHVVGDQLLAPQLEKAARAGEIRRVLDVGTGTGVWCVEFEAELRKLGVNGPVTIVGIDVSEGVDWAQYSDGVARTQGKDKQNGSRLCYELVDLNDDTGFEDLIGKHGPFDLVHSRLIISSIKRGLWPAYLERVSKALRAGGHVQLFEPDLTRWQEWRTDKAAAEYRNVFQAVYYNLGLDVEAGGCLARRLRVTGFSDVRDTVVFAESCARGIDGRIEVHHGSQRWFEETVKVLRPMFVDIERQVLEESNLPLDEMPKNNSEYDDFETRDKQASLNDHLYHGVFHLVVARKQPSARVLTIEKGDDNGVSISSSVI